MQTITPFLWFDNNAEDAMNFYCSIFQDSKVLNTARVGGKILTVTFELNGQKFMGLNGGPMFKFNESVSFFVNCDTQQEIDDYWEKLSQGSSESRCGWVKDKFGLWWQIIPKVLGELLSDPDQEKSQAVMQAMLKMNKMIIADLQRAHEGKAA